MTNRPDADGRFRPKGLTKGAVAILLFSLALLWPAAMAGSPLQFFDSSGYLNTGQTAVAEAGKLVTGAVRQDRDQARAPSPDQPADAEARITRSVYYSTFAYLATVATPVGAWLVILAHGLLISLFLAMLLDRRALDNPAALALCGVALAGFTSLPFFVSWMMPDILAAVVVLNALLVVRGVERIPAVGAIFAFLATSFAILAHYGHVPLAVGIAGFTALLLLLRKRLRPKAILLLTGPVLVALLGNVAFSVVAFDEVSAAPKRLPILLARSLEDGPARWYLDTACPAAGYELCNGLADLPHDLGGLLWREDGLLKDRTPAQLDRIRAEEPAILVRAFLAYPLEQSWSLGGNSVQQFVAVGLDDFHWAPLVRTPDGRWKIQPAEPDRSGLTAIATVQAIVIVAAALGLGWLVVARKLEPARHEPDLLLVLLAGLAINAVIFGGLSVPVDRYQSRLAWMVPMLAALFWMFRRHLPEPAPHAGALPGKASLG